MKLQDDKHWIKYMGLPPQDHELSSAYLMRIPVTVKQDDSISRLKIEPQTACSGTQHEYEVRAVSLIEGLKKYATIISLSCTIQTQILETCWIEITLVILS